MCWLPWWSRQYKPLPFVWKAVGLNPSKVVPLTFKLVFYYLAYEVVLGWAACRLWQPTSLFSLSPLWDISLHAKAFVNHSLKMIYSIKIQLTNLMPCTLLNLRCCTKNASFKNISNKEIDDEVMNWFILCFGTWLLESCSHRQKEISTVGGNNQTADIWRIS